MKPTKPQAVVLHIFLVTEKHARLFNNNTTHKAKTVLKSVGKNGAVRGRDCTSHLSFDGCITQKYTLGSSVGSLGTFMHSVKARMMEHTMQSESKQQRKTALTMSECVSVVLPCACQ